MKRITAIFLLILLSPIISYGTELAWGWRDVNGNILENTPSRKVQNNFGGMLVTTTDITSLKNWASISKTTPRLNEEKSVKIGQQLEIITFFANPKLDIKGNVNVQCSIKITRPDKSISVNEQSLACMRGKFTGNPNVIISSPVGLRFVGEKKDPVGTWLVDVEIKDINRDTLIKLKTSFELIPETQRLPINPDQSSVTTKPSSIPKPASWALPDVIKSARALSPRNVEGREFNQTGLAYSFPELNAVSTAELPAQEIQKYADIVTHAYPDAVSQQIVDSCSQFPVKSLNTVAIAGVAYVSLHAISPTTRQKASECFVYIQTSLKKSHATQ